MVLPSGRLASRYIALSGFIFLLLLSFYHIHNKRDFEAWPAVDDQTFDEQESESWPISGEQPVDNSLNDTPDDPDVPPTPPSTPAASRPTRPKIDWNQRAELVKDAFLHAYRGYEKYALPRDELKPVTVTATDK